MQIYEISDFFLGPQEDENLTTIRKPVITLFLERRSIGSLKHVNLGMDFVSNREMHLEYNVQDRKCTCYGGLMVSGQLCP